MASSYRLPTTGSPFAPVGPALPPVVWGSVHVGAESTSIKDLVLTVTENGGSDKTEATRHFDVLVVGAGISGIGAAYHLKTMCPDHTFAILEGRESLGGTWDLFRYPGVRSDSDMHTLGFSFSPWTEAKAIADGPSILAYLKRTVAEFGIDTHIRYRHQVQRAAFSSKSSTWTVTVSVGTGADPAESTAPLSNGSGEPGETITYTANYLFMCSGYYSYKGGYQPEFPGQEHFAGTVVHPQEWPEDLDYTNKKVVVIGSGATAMTLVPAMADDAAKVTMLQRSPTYVVAKPEQDVVANALRKVLPEKTAYALTRAKNIRLGNFFYEQTRSNPERMRKFLLNSVRKELGPDYDIDQHFTPTYNPWDQRLCLVPNSDLFEAIRSGQADVVTDRIESWTETGIRLESGEHLEADIIITATGLQLVTVGEVDFAVDGNPVDFSETWTYKGMSYSDVPNMATSFGYINASWTLRSDLICDYVCRLLLHMRETGTTQCTPRLRGSDRTMPPRPFIDDFSAGYMQRMMPMLPKQGDRAPWLNTQSYLKDKDLFGVPVNDSVMRFTNGEDAAAIGSSPEADHASV